MVNGTKSDWGKVTSGIPQGSILGPVLFIIYINDLPDIIHSTVLLFADDTKVYRRIDTIEDQDALQTDRMNKWSQNWLLKFHPDKCKAMRVGREDENPYQYKLQEHVLA